MVQLTSSLLLSSLLAFLLHVADGCGRTPARTKPAPTTPNPDEKTTPWTSGGVTKRPSSHRLQCSESEVKEAACLHDGVCYAVFLLDTRSAHCDCSEMWTGTRCEQLNDRFFGNVLSADKVEKAGIAAGVVVVVIIVTVVIVYLIIKKRKQRKQRAENGQANGHAGKALMSDTEKEIECEEIHKVSNV